MPQSPVRQTRIKAEMTTMEILTTMGEGNPGALTVCVSILKHGPAIDPDDLFEGFGTLLTLDMLGIYGSRIWVLFKNVCDGDLVKLMAVTRAYQLGQLGGATEVAINRAIGHSVDSLDVNAVMAAVQQRLPKFGRQPTA
jgi:hypothetical protein